MSNIVFPSLPGEGWPVRKTIVTKTTIQEAANGQEVRFPNFVAPRWKWSLTMNVLRDLPASAFYELTTLLGIFTSKLGPWDSFLYDDPSDHLVTSQLIGTGNGTLKSFQMQRSLASGTQPVYDIKTSLPTPVVYLGGVSQGSGWSISNGLLTFSSAPGNGVQITADFGYYWRVRFLNDETEFEEFAQGFWEGKKVEFISVRA
jgi:uncharacterized protein (TIGR02217 family)